MVERPNCQVTLVSGSCCAPHLAQLDRELDKNIQQALGQIAAQVEVKTVSLSSILEGPQTLNAKQRAQVLSLFQKYSARLCPAVLIGDQVRFAGSVPTVEQLKDALDTAVHEAS
jgi:hypothetical protein